MHGRPRKALKQEDEAALSAKAEKLRSLQSHFLANHRNRIYSKEALDLSAKLLEANPECYTAWNYRKLAVQHSLSLSDSDPQSLFDVELQLVESALRKNFKSYGAWHHRKWVLSKGHSSTDNELRLLNGFQKADPRNFHAWNYRRFVAALMKRSDEDELKYTEEVIGANFSNYSAWHNRSVLLSNLLKRKAEGFSSKEKVLKEEYEHVHNAIFTDPDDQSGWFYHLWLIDQTVKNDVPLLVSSWPSHGSNITLNGNNCLHGCGLSLLNSTLSDTGTLPVIFFFNQAVEGINSSTVAVKSELLKEDLVWRPLSANNSNTAQVWVVYLNLGNMELQPSKSYTIEVSIGHSKGIVSSNGYHYGDPSQTAFKVCVQTAYIDRAEEQCGKMISWKDSDFQKIDHFEESDSIVSADQLMTENRHIPTTSKWCMEEIDEEIAKFRDLLSEYDCKIGKLTLARLLTALDLLSSQSQHDQRKIHTEEILQLYADLMKLDPTHSLYYKDEHSLVLLRKITSSRESLIPYCHYHKDATETITGSVCLRLQNLSLSRMGSIESLLWVQMLDLSHNELRSIEGLEAMQLLSCLNLSHNKLCSFTALAPLRLLKSLKVLNISYNELGSHSIDTRRYLCSSPLAHTEEFAWDRFEILCGSYSATKFWESFLIFESLNLTDLNIAGNAVADENFRSFIVKVLPTLKWLDGEELS